MSDTKELELSVSDLVMQVHDVQDDVNQQAKDLLYHQEYDHDEMGDWDALYDLQREVDELKEQLGTTLNTRLMRPSRRRTMPFTGSYFGSWFSTKDPFLLQYEREARRRARARRQQDRAIMRRARVRRRIVRKART